MPRTVDPNAYWNTFKNTRPSFANKPIEQNQENADKQNISLYQHPSLQDVVGEPISEQEVQDFNKNDVEKGYTLPTDLYEGPGNAPNLGLPHGAADEVAQTHDIKYSHTGWKVQHNLISAEEAQKEIEAADTEAINKFGNLGTLGGVIGHDGLTIKQGAEKLVGPIYPNYRKDAKGLSISGKMPKQIRDYHRKWWEGLTEEQRNKAMLDPNAAHLFVEGAEARIQNQNNAAAREGFKRPGGIAKPFIDAKRNKPTTSAEHNEVNKFRPAEVSEKSGTFAVIEPSDISDPTQAQPSKTIQPEVTAATSSTDIEMGLPGTGQGTGGSGDGNADGAMEIYSPERPISMFGSKISTYRKVHRFLTFAIAPNWIEINLTTPTESQRWLSTCLAEIPWDKPVLYLNQSEFDLIPDGSYVKEVRVKIVHRGNRIAFETGELATRLATLNQIQNIVTAFGVNKTGWGVNKTYTGFAMGNPMLPTSLGNAIYNTLDDEWYGFPNASASFTSVIPAHQLGIDYALDNYFCLANAVENFGGVPPLQECMQYMDGKTTIDKTIGEFNYVPKMGMLKRPLKHLRSGLPIMQSSQILVNGVIESGTVVNPASGTIDATGAIQTNNSALRNPSNAFTASTDFDMFAFIEKSDILRQGQWGQYQKAHVQPSIHVGIQAIPSLTSTNILGPIQNWTDAQATWDVICEMDVVEHQPTKLPHATAANVPAGEVIYDTAQGLRSTQNSCTFAGLHTVNGIR